jgi:hypothetical protein
MPANYEPENAMGNLAMRSRLWRATLIAGALVLVYLAVAYVLMPTLWSRYAQRHPAFEGMPDITYSGDGHPADPLNVALAGTERELKMIMIAAHWYPADPLSLKSCLEIAEATVLKRPYDAAPVSSLYLSSAPSFEGSSAGAELARNMVNPIHDSTPPPATEKASSDTPDTCSNLAPTRAATTRMASTASAAWVASASRAARAWPASIRANMAPERTDRLKVLFHLYERSLRDPASAVDARIVSADGNGERNLRDVFDQRLDQSPISSVR